MAALEVTNEQIRVRKFSKSSQNINEALFPKRNSTRYPLLFYCVVVIKTPTLTLLYTYLEAPLLLKPLIQKAKQK